HFPVLLDPTITVQPDTQDASFAMGCNCVASVGSWLAIGTDPGGAWRAALQFDLSSIPAGTAVTSAQLGLYDDWTCPSVCGNNHTIEAHRMTAPWSTSATSSQLQFDSTVLSTVPVTAGQVVGWLYWPITTTVQNWLSGAQPNYGLLMKRDTEPLGVGGI